MALLIFFPSFCFPTKFSELKLKNEIYLPFLQGRELLFYSSKREGEEGDFQSSHLKMDV